MNNWQLLNEMYRFFPKNKSQEKINIFIREALDTGQVGVRFKYKLYLNVSKKY